MRDNDGRKLDHQTLEQLRIRAVEQIQAGAHPEDIAAALGMARSTVFGWLAKYRQGGTDALRARPVPGRPRKLSGVQLRTVYELIVGRDPRQLQFPFALWTRELVRELIRREFGVALSAVSVGRLLRTLGLSPQRPLWRASQQNPDRVAAWKQDEYPAIRAQAAQVGPGSTSLTRPASARRTTRATTRARPGRRSGRRPWSGPPASAIRST
jgi:transposase